MSKSKGNFLTLRGACPTGDDVRAYRYLVVSSQYRNPLSFTEAALGAAKGALKRLDRAKLMIEEALSDEDVDGFASYSGSEIAVRVEKELANFEVAIADDLSMPRASACLFSVVKAAETEFKRVAKAVTNDGGEETNSSTLDLIGLARVKQALEQMDKVFGIYYDVPNEKKDEPSESSGDTGDGKGIPEEVMQLVALRTEAKDAKDWDVADSLRAKITELGYAVKDVKGGDPIVTKA